ncbi:DUF2206 domain-containing protein [Methanothermococcus sp. SCGC AD-155-C09]|nr:DUF2206 domain-containing protein [Methanothermococcus sp. SCGC AD-155-C09]
MNLSNPFKLQNWKFKKFLISILFFQISLLGLFALNNLGVDTPIIRPLMGFIYLTIIPGYLLLRILKLHNLNNIESFLYAIGLSLFLNMFVGFLINMFYPLLGITDKPIAEVPIILTMALVVGILSIVAYIRDRDYEDPDYLPIGDIINPQVLFLSLIPFMAIFGTYLVNYYNINILLMVMIVVIALVSLIVGFTNWINEKYYPYAIWVMAISLILHISLFTNYIPVQDVYGEFYSANSVISNHVWRYDLPFSYNSVLSATLLPSFIYYICNIKLNWIYKIIFPVLCSFLPVGLYSIYTNFLNNNKKLSFLASYLFTIIIPFYTIIPFLTKQLVAEIFLLLILILLLVLKLNKFKKMILFTIFSASLIVSHYGTSYLVMGMLLFSIIFIKILEVLKKERIINQISGEIINFTLFYIIFTLGWYMYISKSVSFISLVNLGNTIINSIFTEFLNPDYSRGAYTLVKPLPFLGQLLKYMYLTISGLIFIGYLKTFYDLFKSKYKFNMLYLAFSAYWLIILGAAVAVPFFAVMNPYRLYHLAFFTLAPFSVAGFTFISHMIKNFEINIGYKNIIKILIIFLLIFMFLNTKFLNEVVEQPPYSRYLSKYTILNYEYSNINETGKFYSGIITTYDVFGSKWLSIYGNSNYKIYSGSWAFGNAPLHAYGNIPLSRVKDITINIKKGSYIFFMELLVKYKIWYYNDPLAAKTLIYYNATQHYYNLTMKCSRIYDNGGNQVLIC